ncbi:OmpH family outer membrane protein [Paracoccus aminovorans]|uniref:OmpH family outer membrane protein n=1 Tax=Paracoccus aminovorans TaxID=34004 RepID=UPI002B25F245|nr:OmpH family outer membrane protein [Paracoccus aminovorans]
MRVGRGIAAWGLAALLAAPAAAPAQPVGPSPLEGAGGRQGSAPIVVDTPTPQGEGVLPVMTLDQAALYARSQWGQRVQAELEQRQREMEAENDRLTSEFAAEERSLTLLRQTLSAEEFRKRADEFDKRVVEVRRSFDAAAKELHNRDAAEQQAFFRAALPLLAAMMRERGAVVVLDQRAIFVASQSIDVTDALIARMDEEIGAGPLEEEAPAPDAPDAEPGAADAAPNPRDAGKAAPQPAD